jgi:excisionase family DNA binding protein
MNLKEVRQHETVTDLLLNIKEKCNMNNTLPNPLLLNITQVCQLLGLSRSKVHILIKLEGLPIIRFGRAIRVSPDALQRWLDSRTSE